MSAGGLGIAVAATIVLLQLAGCLGVAVLLLLVGPRRRELLKARLLRLRGGPGARPRTQDRPSSSLAAHVTLAVEMALPERRGKSRLGCLGGAALLLVLGPVVFLLIDAAFAPWAFVLGGRFHPLPYWQGWGVLRAPPAGDFVVLVRMWPTPGSRNGYPSVTGSAELCTPRAERFSLQLTGEFVRKHVWLHPDRMPMYLHLYRRPWYYSFVTVDRRPRLDLHGPWRGPDLVMDDHGTLSRAFLPDGRLFPGPPQDQPAARRNASVTIREGSHADFDAACRAAAR